MFIFHKWPNRDQKASPALPKQNPFWFNHSDASSHLWLNKFLISIETTVYLSRRAALARVRLEIRGGILDSFENIDGRGKERSSVRLRQGYGTYFGQENKERQIPEWMDGNNININEEKLDFWSFVVFTLLWMALWARKEGIPRGKSAGCREYNRIWFSPLQGSLAFL